MNLQRKKMEGVNGDDGGDGFSSAHLAKSLEVISSLTSRYCCKSLMSE